MKIALASRAFPISIDDGLYWVEKLVKEAAEKQAAIICFPESYLPGYPIKAYNVEQSTPQKLKIAFDKVCAVAAENAIAVIIPMDWYDEQGNLINVAQVITAKGEVSGYQTKNQLDPTEDNIWMPGTERQLFEVNGLKFGITICHEGFRYPESVRWAARNGAHIVFHPHLTGSDLEKDKPAENSHTPYYEKAMMMRALENTIYFASVGYTMKYPEAATSLIAPDGVCIAFQPYFVPGVLVQEIDPGKATGFLAKRFKPELYK